MGGKTRLAPWVAASVVGLAGGRSKYLEPFVGSGAVFAQLAPRFVQATAADAHPDLIMLLEAVAGGWVPPEEVSKLDYMRLRDSPPSAMRGFVGFGSSRNGKFFASYADRPWDRYHGRPASPYAAAARAALLRLRPVLAGSGVRLVCCDYKDHEVDQATVVYCDPPYAGTTGYDGCSVGFDSKEFWTVAAGWAERGAAVVVSEERAPVGWAVLDRRLVRSGMVPGGSGGANFRWESLWVPRKTGG